MTVTLKGHDYKYAVEQMLLFPHEMFHFVGTPVEFNYSRAEVNSAPLRATGRGRVSSTEGGGRR